MFSGSYSLDFVQMPEAGGKNYILVMVDALSRFVQLVACHKNSGVETILELVLQNWIQKFGPVREIRSDNDVRFTSPTGWWRTVLDRLGIKVSFTSPMRPQSNGLVERTNRRVVKAFRVLMSSSPHRDWTKWVYWVNMLLNKQVDSKTMLSPNVMFLGRDVQLQFSQTSVDHGDHIEEWLQAQLQMQRECQEALSKNRYLEWSKHNKQRADHKYSEGDHVLIHKQRFPKRTLEKWEAQWFGPFVVIRVEIGRCLVRVPHHFGRESHHHLRLWPMESNPSEVKKNFEGDDVCEDAENQIDLEELKENVGEELHEVESILSHKEEQGFKFLVKWKGYGMNEATWEPATTFVWVNKNGDVVLNEVFQEYCVKRSLEKVVRKARGNALRRAKL